MDFLETITLAQWISYLASFFVLGSFLMKDLRKLRIVNSIGCVFFVCYGILLNNDVAIIVTNFGILLLNTYYLFIKKNN